MNLVNEKLAAELHLRQIEAIIRLEALTEKMLAEFRYPAEATIEATLVGKMEPRIFRLLWQSAVHRVIEHLREDWAEFAYWSHDSLIEAYAKAIPASYYRAIRPEFTIYGLEDEQTDKILPKRISIGELIADLFTEPIASVKRKFSSLGEWVKVLKELVFPPPSRLDVDILIDTPGPDGKDWQDRLLILSRKVPDADALASQLAYGYSQGENQQQLKTRIKPFVSNLEASTKRIVRTEGLRIAEQIQRNSWKHFGEMLIGAQIVAVLDNRTRPEHALRNGMVYYRQPEGDQLSMVQLPILPDEPNCILPGQAVGGQFSGGLKAWYSGQVFKFTMRSGRTLAVTANHPVMTTEGFVAANKIKKLDNLITDNLEGVLPGEVPGNVENAPLPIEEVFESLRNSVFAHVSNPVIGDLHGDAVKVQGEVEVVDIERVLLDDFATSASQNFSVPMLRFPDMELPFKSGLGSLELANESISVATPSLPSGGKLTLNHPPIGLDSRPLDCLCLGLTSELHASFLKSIRDHASADSMLFGQLVDRFPEFVVVDEVIDIQISDYSGHVYDLQSEVGWYSVGGVIVHNCRCQTTPVLAPPDEILDNPELMTDFENASGEVITDPTTYDQWFLQADEVRRKLAVGTRRYQAVQKMLDREPEWTDFVSETGSLIPTDQLKRETADDRLARKALVSELLTKRREKLRQISQFGFVL